MAIYLHSDPNWVYIWPSTDRPGYATMSEKMLHGGKWVIEGNARYMVELAVQLDPFVESGHITCAKYTKKDPDHDPLPNIKEHAMIVFSDDRVMDLTADLLRRLGVKEMEWKYTRESVIDTAPGGWMYEMARQAGRSIPPDY